MQREQKALRFHTVQTDTSAAVGVLSGLAAYEELEKEADIVLENVGEIPDYLADQSI